MKNQILICQFCDSVEYMMRYLKDRVKNAKSTHDNFRRKFSSDLKSRESFIDNTIPKSLDAFTSDQKKDMRSLLDYYLETPGRRELPTRESLQQNFKNETFWEASKLKFNIIFRLFTNVCDNYLASVDYSL